MTNEERVRANHRTHPKQMTRGQLQTAALVIESLLNSVMALNSRVDPDYGFTLVEMAHARAVKLNTSLDEVNGAEVTS